MDLRNRVEQIAATVRELREAAGDGPRTRRLIDSLFRTVHSLKAAASAESLDDLSRSAHECESLLHSLRTGALTLDGEVLRTFDDAVVALLSGSPASFEKLTNQENRSGAQLPAEFADLKDEERHRATEAIREGSNLYVMEVTFDAGDFDRRFRELKHQLEQGSEIISTSARMEQEKINFRIFYAAKSAKIPLQKLFRQVVHAGNSIATSLGKEIAFVAQGDEVLIEEAICDAIAESLLHLVRNAVDHGIESRGAVTLDATSEAGQVIISVADDGRGIKPATLPHVFQPGFSTAKDVSELSGRGVGLDVVKTVVESAGGSVSVTSEPGKGSSFKIRMPNPSSDA